METAAAGMIRRRHTTPHHTHNMGHHIMENMTTLYGHYLHVVCAIRDADLIGVVTRELNDVERSYMADALRTIHDDETADECDECGEYNICNGACTK